jgi:hypothetical protein
MPGTAPILVDEAQWQLSFEAHFLHFHVREALCGLAELVRLEEQPVSATSRPTKKQRDDERRAAAAAAKLALAKSARRRKILLGGVVAIVVAIVTALVVAGLTRPSHQSAHGSALPNPVEAPGGGNPPWSAPVDPDAKITGAELRLLNQEGTALHFHAHLDVLINGAAVPVPADLGINVKAQKISEMHTHDASGVIHIEAPDDTRRYVLGQLFAEWGVRLDASHVGDLATSSNKTLVAYVNGKPVTGDPAQIELTAHEQITLVYGDKGTTPNVASSYKFPAGE